MNKLNNKLYISVLLIFTLLFFSVTVTAKLIPVEVITANKSDISQVKIINGKIIPYKNIQLSSQIGGIVDKVNIEVGQTVNQNEKLVIFDQDEIILQVKQAEATLKAARANLQRLKNGAEAEQIEASTAAVEQAKAALDQARANYEMAKEGALAEDIERAEASFNQATASFEGAESSLEIIKSIYKDRTAQKQQMINAEIQVKTTKKQVESAEARLEQSRIGLDQARNNYEKARVNLEQAEKEYNRVKSLYEEKVVSQKQYDLVENQLKNAKSAVKNAKTAVENARQAIESARIAREQAEISHQGAVENYKLAKYTYENPFRLKQQFDSAQTQVEVAQANKELAKANLEKIKKGTRKEKLAVSRAGVARSEASLKAARAKLAQLKNGASSEEIKASEANVEKAEVALNLARKRLQDSVITSPVNGIIASVNVETGEMVNPGTPITSVVDLNQVYVQTDISADVLKELSTGDKAGVNILAYNEFKQGVIKNISPVADPRTQSYPVKILLDNRGLKLKGGMFADVHFNLASSQNTLVLPVESVVDLDGDPYVFIVNNGKVEKRVIKTGLINEKLVEVLKGVSAGEKVVVDGQYSLQTGDKVEVISR